MLKLSNTCSLNAVKLQMKNYAAASGKYVFKYLQIVRLYKNAISREKISVFDLAYVTYNYITNRDLFHLALSDDGKLVLPFNSTLQSSKLPFFCIIIKCCYKHNYDNRY